MKIYQAESALDFEEFANLCLAPGREGCIYYISPSVSVWTGQLSTLNFDVCARLGLFVGQGQYLGGSIVNMSGDLSICITTWGNSELAPQIIDSMAELLQNTGEISYDENDVLLDGKKVLSWARATMITGWQQSVVHCSIGPMDLDLVKEVCTKPMEKIPGSLGDYGITAQDLLEIAEPILLSA